MNLRYAVTTLVLMLLVLPISNGQVTYKKSHASKGEWVENANAVYAGGKIVRRWGSGDEFTWDGQVLRRLWSTSNEEWSFDGRIIKRKWNTGNDEFEWDGEKLRRVWNTGDDEFSWDGETLKRKWNTGGDEFILQGDVIKRKWNTQDDEWEISGDVPIPVIAIVVFGFFDAK